MPAAARLSAFCVATAVLLGGGCPAFADSPDDALASLDLAAAGTLTGGHHPESMLFFSGFDLWRGGGSAYGGLQWAPAGLSQDGFTLKLLLAEGTYRYRAGMTDIRGTGLLAAVMPGWRIKRGDLEVRIFAGLDLQHHTLSPDDPANALRGGRAGARVNADLWWEPTAAMMAASSVSASTIGNSFGVRAALGWRLADRFWTGPEIEASGDKVYRQYRIGAHVTALKIAPFEWSLGAGYVEDNSHRSGLYGRISLLARQ